jgi:hypothetical protein
MTAQACWSAVFSGYHMYNCSVTGNSIKEELVVCCA